MEKIFHQKAISEQISNLEGSKRHYLGIKYTVNAGYFAHFTL